MRNGRSIAAFVAIVLFPAPAWSEVSAFKPGPLQLVGARAGPSSETLSSPSAADQFREIALEAALAKDAAAPQIDEAIILLTAAKNLGGKQADALPWLLRLATRHPQKDRSDQVILWLQEYVSASADRVVVADAVRYLLDRLNSREERITLLTRLASIIGNKSLAVDSDLATRLGVLMIEKADAAAAQRYLIQAYANDKYNKLAFAKLAELAPSEIGPGIYMERLRLALRENPLDLNAALAFAQYAERLQLYELAAQSYQYGAELFRYLYPAEPLPPHLYLPWAITCYNTERGRHLCPQIAENVRATGRFDILLEAIAGKAAAKIGHPGEAEKILRQAEQKAQALLQSGTGTVGPLAAANSVRPVHARQLAWFYCFAEPQPDKALDWANKAYSSEPNSPVTSALLAYALSLNNQMEWAKPLLASSENSQVADLVQARIEASEGQKAKAVLTLKAAITKDAGSLTAERAREMLLELGAEYAPPVDPSVLLTFLTEKLGKTLIPQFIPPDKLMEVQFSLRGNEFAYGSELEATVSIANKSVEPLILTDGSLFQGRIRIDARVSGDIQREVPHLIAETIRTDPAIAPGRSLVRTLRLSTGELRRLLLACPQASCAIQFTLYADPVVAESGAVSNRLVDLKPVLVSITRPRVDVTASYIRDRFNAISSGQEGQKIRTAQLFTGLLKEQYAMSEHGALYPYRYAAWLPEQLRLGLLSDAGLLLNDGADEWVVKVNAMADMLSLPVDRDLATAVSRNLSHPRWPVRLMAVYLLAKGSGDDFSRVLDWVAQNDAHDLVRAIAMSLRSAPTSAMAQSAALGPAGSILPRTPSH